MNGNHVGGGRTEEDAQNQSITDIASQQSSWKKLVISFRLRYQKARYIMTVSVEPRDRNGHLPYVDRKHELLQLRIPQARMSELLWQELFDWKLSPNTFFFNSRGYFWEMCYKNFPLQIEAQITFRKPLQSATSCEKWYKNILISHGGLQAVAAKWLPTNVLASPLRATISDKGSEKEREIRKHWHRFSLNRGKCKIWKLPAAATWPKATLI